VPGGVQTVAPDGRHRPVYDVANFQILQGDLIRGYDRSGRRVIAQPSACAERAETSRTRAAPRAA
jgi:hypothetical protein